jgi:glycosyltransferase involved in cell wall biosynthesis
MTRKPRILLIPNVAWWIIGEMGRQIIARFGDQYDFYFVPEGLFERRPELLHAFIPSVDAIHCLNESSIELFRNLDPKSLPPIITWIHHITEWSPQHQLSVQRSAALIACTEAWKQSIAQHAPGGPPITVVPHGVDLAFFQRRKVPAGAFGIPPGRFVVGFIGTKGSDRDRGRKGTDTLLSVIRTAAQQISHLHVVLGGPGWESELDNLRSLGLSVSATGYIPKAELPRLYSALDVYLMTSRVEGGPCTVFEAMACGTPVVATRVGAVPELILDGINGWSAEINDVDSLVAALATLARDRLRRDAIAVAARNTVSQRTWADALAPLAPVYASLTASQSSRQPAPTWMRRPRKVLRASSTADALASIIAGVRTGKLSGKQGLRSLFDMLDTRSPLDLLRGLAMLRGWSYRASRRANAPAAAAPDNNSTEEPHEWDRTPTDTTRV